MSLSALPDPGATSESEEMYLITVARAAEDGATGPVPIAVLAKDLQVSVASANEMVRKLAGRGLVTYEPYRGVELTDSGRAVSRRVLRTRRLWATFLSDHLGFSPQDADDQACLFEHVTIPEATARLAEYLGDPQTGPLGKPIPHGGAAPPQPAESLAGLEAGAGAEVVAVPEAPQIESFLAAEGVVPGAFVSVVAGGSSGVLVRTDGKLVHVTDEIADRILIRRIGRSK